MKYFLTTINILLSLFLFSQTPDDEINFKEFDAAFFENLLEEKVNAYRKEKGIHLLETDEYLYLAALDQSKYIFKTKKATSNQPTKKKATPFDRVIFYDGLHSLVAENNSIIVTKRKVKIGSIKKSVLLKSYKDVSDYVFETWKKSKSFSKSMLNPAFYRFSTATEVDEKEKIIVVTQVYASTPFNLPEGVKYEKENYKVAAYNREKCNSLEKKYGYLPELMSDNLYFKDGQIYFYFHDLALFKDVLKESNDAIALDIISREQFACGAGNVYFPSKIHKGIMLPPIHKSQLFGKNELKKEGQLEVSLGPIPPYVDTNNVEFNLLIIKDDCLCQTIVYNSLGGENLKSLNLGFVVDTLSVSNQADSIINQLKFTVPFERNKFQYNDDDIKPFLDSIELKRFDLKKIEIVAYSSIEGGVKGNETLQSKRAKSILKAINNYNLTDVETNIILKENWEGFYESLKGSPYEKEFSKKTQEEIREIINTDTLNYNLEPYLEDQRKADITLTVEKIFMDDALLKVVPERLKRSLENKDYVKARVYQSILLSNVKKGKIDKEVVLNMEIPHLKETVVLNNNQIAFKWYYSSTTNRDSLHKELLRDIENQLHISPTNNYLLYNKLLLNLLLWTNKYSRVTNPKYLLKDIKLLYNTGIANWKVNQLMLNYHLISADFYYESKKFPEREKALKEVRKILLQSQLTRDQTFRISNYFMFQMRIDWGIELMKPWVKKATIDEDFLFTFLTIAIYNKELVPEKEYVQFMARAKEMNQERFCSLFGYPNMSFQLLEDLPVKEMYCKTCK